MSVHEHPVVPAEGDFFALKTICQACDTLAYWRLGRREWEHYPEEVTDQCAHPCDHCRPDEWHSCVLAAGHDGWHACQEGQ